MSAAPRSELQLRVLSGIAMAVAAIAVAWLGGPVFAVVWTGIAVIVLLEWLSIASPEAPLPLRGLACAVVLFAAAATYFGNGWLAFGAVELAAVAIWWSRPGHRKDVAIGLLYAAGLASAVIACRGKTPEGMIVIFWLFAAVWGTDTFAYFTGRTLGGPKLWPAVSPKKTWSGAIGGLVGAVVLGFVVLTAFGVAAHTGHVVLTLVFSIATQAGDLFESAFKRRFGVKDSGNIIPGHGGAMDRLDGFIFASVAALLFGVLASGSLAQVPLALLGLQGM